MVQTKGTGVLAGLRWFRKRHGDAAYAQMIGMLPADQQPLTKAILPSQWYPASMAGNLQRAMVSFAPTGDRAAIERYLKEMSREIAEHNLSAFYRAMLFVMSAERLFASLPRIWGTYYRGIEVTVVHADGTSHGTCTVRWAGQVVPYLAPVACGWLETAFAKVGSQLTIYEENWVRGKDRGEPLVFDLAWT